VQLELLLEPDDDLCTSPALDTLSLKARSLKFVLEVCDLFQEIRVLLLELRDPVNDRVSAMLSDHLTLPGSSIFFGSYGLGRELNRRSKRVRLEIGVHMADRVRKSLWFVTRTW